MRILMVCSSGGHLAQLFPLRPFWSRHERAWVTFDTPDAVSLLAGETLIPCHRPTTRNLKNLVRNTFLARRVIKDYRPDLILSNGAAVAFPFFMVGRLRGVKTVFIEEFAHVNHPTLTGRLCHPLANRFFLQWEEQRSHFKKGEFLGGLLFDPGLLIGNGSGPRPVADGSVFVTVGTDHHPFDRMLDWIEAWPGIGRAPIFVQYAHSRPPTRVAGAAYIEHENMVDRMLRATAVVSHGGPATIAIALGLGKRPIVVPRRSALGEHVEDHQVDFSAKLAIEGLIDLAETPEQLHRLIEERLAGSVPPTASLGSQQALRRFEAIMEAMSLSNAPASE